jgi:hypothetical protein
MKEYKVKVYSDRTEWYNLEGQRHREDGPAIKYTDGSKSYYINGVRHRKDGPAIEGASGGKEYYINGKYLTEEEFNNRNKSCENKIVEIEGVKYKLTKV